MDGPPSKEACSALIDVRNLIVISDTHFGCQLALCHPDGAALDNGGIYKPSALQLKLWEIWRQFWDEWVPRVTRNEPYAVVFNGDAIDGEHHRSTTQWSHNMEDQRKHAEKVLGEVVDKCHGRYFHIRGTEAHVGKSGQEEETLARNLAAIASPSGNHARWELWKRIGEDGLVHFTHHVGTTSSAAHETSAINAELASAFNEAGRWNNEPPDILVRSHRHRSAEIRLPANKGYATCFVTAAWQLKTPFVYRIAGGRNSVPQIGGSLIRLGDEELHTRHFVHDIGRGEPE